MINEPSVDVMIRKLGTEEEPISRYALCTIAAKRAMDSSESLIPGTIKSSESSYSAPKRAFSVLQTQFYQ